MNTYTPVQKFSGKDKKHLIVIFESLIDILETGESEIQYYRKDLHYYYSLKTRLYEKKYISNLNKIINNLKMNNKVEIEYTKNDINFLKYLSGIIFNNIML